MAARYQVQEGGDGFEASVIDITDPFILNGKHARDEWEGGEYRYGVLCECTDAADAYVICDALNAKWIAELMSTVLLRKGEPLVHTYPPRNNWKTMPASISVAGHPQN